MHPTTANDENDDAISDDDNSSSEKIEVPRCCESFEDGKDTVPLLQVCDSFTDNIDEHGVENDGVVSCEVDKTKSAKNKLDKCLLVYSNFASSALYTDRGLKLLQWSLWLASRLIVRKWPSSSTAKQVAASLRKLYFDVSMTRYTLRLYGGVGALDGVRSGGWCGARPHDGSSWENPRISSLGKLMAWSMLFYHPLEFLAWIQWSMPTLHLPKRLWSGNRCSAWSCRFWLIYILADWWSVVLKNRELNNCKSRSLCNKWDDEEETDVLMINRAIRHNQLQIIRDAFFTLPCLSWSLPKWDTDPLLSESIVNGLSWCESVVCMYQTIRSLL